MKKKVILIVSALLIVIAITLIFTLRRGSQDNPIAFHFSNSNTNSNGSPFYTCIVSNRSDRKIMKWGSIFIDQKKSGIFTNHQEYHRTFVELNPTISEMSPGSTRKISFDLPATTGSHPNQMSLDTNSFTVGVRWAGKFKSELAIWLGKLSTDKKYQENQISSSEQLIIMNDKGFLKNSKD